MKVTNQHFINEANLSDDKKRIILSFNFPPDTNHLIVTNIAVMCNGEKNVNILSKLNPRIGFVYKNKKQFCVRLKMLPPTESVFKIRIKNPKTQDYEDTSFLFDGNDFKKSDPNSK